jgi:hypothetical protein
MSNIEFGVIEDRNDPKMMGRYRVRVIGRHSQSLVDIPRDTLPWATVMMPVTGASVSGVGSTSALLEGSWVAVVFLDEYMQDPIIIGSIQGMPDQEISTSVGFSDPNGIYPKYLNAPDVNELARGTNNITDGPGPASPYAAKYPHNKVIMTESGHVIEMDDTPNAERLRVVHKSGTSVEIHPNGDIVHKNKNKWEITTGDEECIITGNLKIIAADVRIESPMVTMTGDLRVDGGISVGNDVVTDAGISHNSHTHTDSAGLGAGSTSTPI